MTVFPGPLFAPFVGGFIVESYLGWRWTEYLTGIMGATAFVLDLFFLEETYPPVVLIGKAAKLRQRTRNWGIHAKQEETEVEFGELIGKNFSRPLRILFTEPIVLLLRYRSDIHWIVPTLSGLLTGFGLFCIFLQCLNYIVDAYLVFAASALAANSVLRSTAGAGFPLFSTYMFNALGVNWTGTLLGCVAAILMPIPLLFYLYGPKTRAKSKFAMEYIVAVQAHNDEHGE
ncbi:uncharacterized transporter C569.05c [Aspergillus udagawae]|uniref:Uncharacterized transporter C569.05c n=1 Tax=Aspergillus udagawae TaxID=91492 RepID=A0ABQ1B6X0_9EURO|nr:uncharacterized transporter C569.05c [Aspergillus udagawae]GFF94962.1 uncharacterized transporter C569.05c [Aspergillus udagawae]GFG13016.1 uncharacterized transporter C569.05c [Aspergillus udagawae]GFG27847.1 uncharacterized transporter C569.05c [Aspergillus udagawae]